MRRGDSPSHAEWIPNWPFIFEAELTITLGFLLVSHGENAVPGEWRLVEEGFFAAFLVGARGACGRPGFQNGLERLLCFLPAARFIEGSCSDEAS